MRWLEIRRHALTKKGEARGRGSHLSAEGVALARAVGACLGPFAKVVASPVPRTAETALAMGFAVDDIVDLPSGYVPGLLDHHAQWSWPHPYARYAELIAQGGAVAHIAATIRTALIRIVAAVPDGSAALLISHGGTIEPALVACLPDADHTSWGAALSHLDGARLTFDNGTFVDIQLRRRDRGSARGGGCGGFGRLSRWALDLGERAEQKPAREGAGQPGGPLSSIAPPRMASSTSRSPIQTSTIVRRVVSTVSSTSKPGIGQAQLDLGRFDPQPVTAALARQIAKPEHHHGGPLGQARGVEVAAQIPHQQHRIELARSACAAPSAGPTCPSPITTGSSSRPAAVR